MPNLAVSAQTADQVAFVLTNKGFLVFMAGTEKLRQPGSVVLSVRTGGWESRSVPNF